MIVNYRHDGYIFDLESLSALSKTKVALEKSMKKLLKVFLPKLK